MQKYILIISVLYKCISLSCLLITGSNLKIRQSQQLGKCKKIVKGGYIVNYDKSAIRFNPDKVFMILLNTDR